MEIQKIDYRKNLSRYRRLYDQRIDPFVKSKHATAYSMIIFSIFTIAFFGMFAIRPTLKTIIELKRQIEDSKQINETLRKKIDALVTAQEEFQFIKDFLPAINEALPEQPNIAKVLTKIEDLANQNQATISALQVQSISFKNTPADEGKKAKTIVPQPTSIDISLKLAGTYRQLSSFLQGLFTMRREVDTTSLELTPETTGANATLKLLLKINTYYLK